MTAYLVADDGGGGGGHFTITNTRVFPKEPLYPPIFQMTTFSLNVQIPDSLEIEIC